MPLLILWRQWNVRETNSKSCFNTFNTIISSLRHTYLRNSAGRFAFVHHVPAVSRCLPLHHSSKKNDKSFPDLLVGRAVCAQLVQPSDRDPLWLQRGRRSNRNFISMTASINSAALLSEELKHFWACLDNLHHFRSFNAGLCHHSYIIAAGQLDHPFSIP